MADSCPQGHRREQAMIFTRLAIIVAVLMALAVPGVRGTLMVLDARRRARSPAPAQAGEGVQASFSGVAG
jgi:hypothetical protein